MSEDFFNDTFDNVSFTFTEKVVTEDRVSINDHYSQVLTKNLSTVTNKSCEKSDLSYREANSERDVSNYKQLSEILKHVSLDDSAFLSESFSFTSGDGQSIKVDPYKNSLIVSNNEACVLNERNKVDDVSIKENKDTERYSPLHVASLPKSDVKDHIDSLKTQSSEASSNIERCNLSFWGLPESILQKYINHRITNMFQWQAECLGNKNVLENQCNLVYSAPTSAGKTLVAEILAIKTVLERQKKVIFILPFISVVREKMFYFQDILGSSGVRVDGLMGSYNPPGGFQAIQVAICTIEKANSLVNRLLEDGTLSDIGAVIVDEMHLLGDASRGYLLELLLTKLRFMSVRENAVNIQIIGMSATLPNLDVLAKWLKAELYTTSFRPIPLYEKFHVAGEIYSNVLKLERKLMRLPELDADTDNILQLCLETIKNSCSVLIFCPTKCWCENLAEQTAVAIWKLGKLQTQSGQILRENLNPDAISEVLEQLKCCPVGLDKVLAKTVSFGVAFHHAGLTMDERDIIEGAFRNGAVRILIATSTLSSGVNLPARRVIIRTPVFHGKPIDILTYQQMIGRAGRMGKDTAGESILICQKNDHSTAKYLMSAKLEPIESCLEGSGKLKRAILEVIASGVATSPEDVQLFTSCTLLAVTEDDSCLVNPIEEAVQFLENNEFIRLQLQHCGGSRYVATSLGKACLSSSIPPEDGLALFTELEKARQCFVLETELHLIYLVTPYSACSQWVNLDWMLFLDLWEKLPVSMKRVGELVGIKESYIINGTRGKIQTTTSKSYHKLQVHKRFYTALALQDLVNEVPLGEVAIKFNCSRGMLQSLQQSASTFAGMVTTFSRHLGWSSVEILISQFQDRLQFGISRELLDLMRLPILNGPRARILFNGSIETLVHLAGSDVCALENLLYKSIPFESEKEREGENKYDAEQRNKIRGIWITGKQGLTIKEAAVMLIENARTYLQYEMGLSEAKWGSLNDSDESSSSIESSGPTTKSDIPTYRDHTEPKNSNSVVNDYALNKQPTSHATSINGAKEKLEMLIPSHNSCSKNDIQLSNISVSSSESIWNETRFKSNAAKSTPKNINESELSNQSLFEESFDLCDHLNTAAVLDIESSSSENGENTVIPRKTNSDFEHANRDSPQDRLSTSNNSNDFVANSQSESTAINSVITPAKQSSRKRERVSENLLFQQTPPKKKKIDKKGEQYRTENVKNTAGCSKTDYVDAVDLASINIVDVCEHKKLYNVFQKELLQQKELSLSVACKRVVENKAIIGAMVVGKSRNITGKQNEFVYKTRQVCGFAVSWGGNTSCFISLENSDVIKNNAKINLLRIILNKKTLKVRFFDSKEQIKVLKLCCDIELKTQIEDSKVVDWMLQPEGKEKNLQAMCVTYCPEAVSLSQLAGSCKGVGSVGIDLHSSIEPRIRASVECLVSWHLIDSVRDILVEQNSDLLETYRIEMCSMLCLARMELSGIRVDVSKLQHSVDLLKEQSDALQKKAYELAGRHFSFTSSTEVAKILGIYRGRKVSTSKQVLEAHEKPISNLILLWRKLNSILTKMVYPLITLVENNHIHGCCVTHNSTGRISMIEPNLQNVARDFDIIDSLTGKSLSISCRDAFVPDDDNFLLSADYCQLELRLLSHLAGDALLCSIMKTKEDVFKSIAAKWNSISESEVDDRLRQRAKQICYGIIYGMGTKSLAQEMSITEQEAGSFMINFHNKYPGIKKYINEIVLKCKEVGYIETIAGRRRYLPNINHEHQGIKSQAERQAVNTTVQGSAADIAKKAMVCVDHSLQHVFRSSKCKPKLILHLHDELLYDVPQKYINKVAKILKQSMEGAVKLSVPFPVKLKWGKSWGSMEEYIL